MKVFPPPLPSNMINEYIILAKQGDQNAITKIIAHNERIIASIIYNKFGYAINKNSFLTFDDLMNIGREAIFEALNTFDLKLNVQFITYIYKPIYWKIEREVRKHNKLNNEISLDTLKQNTFADSINNLRPFINYISKKSLENKEEDIETQILNQELYEGIRNCLSILTPKEKIVVSLHVGFNSYPLDFKDIVEFFKESDQKVSYQRVHSLWQSALQKINFHLIKQGLFPITQLYIDIQNIKKMDYKNKALFLASLFKKSKLSFNLFAETYDISVLELQHIFLDILPIYNYEEYLKIFELLLPNQKKELLATITTDFDNIKNQLFQIFPEDNLDLIKLFYNKLSEDEKYILCFKLSSSEIITFEDIGFYLGLSSSLIGKYYNQIITNLKTLISSKNLEPSIKHLTFKKPIRKINDFIPNNINLKEALSFLDVSDQSLFNSYFNQESIKKITENFHITEEVFFKRLKRIINIIKAFLEELFPSSCSSQSDYEFEESKDEIKKFIYSLSNCFEQKIMFLRFGYLNGHSFNVTEISALTGIKEDSIQQIIDYNISRLRNISNKNKKDVLRLNYKQIRKQIRKQI